MAEEEEVFSQLTTWRTGNNDHYATEAPATFNETLSTMNRTMKTVHEGRFRPSMVRLRLLTRIERKIVFEWAPPRPAPVYPGLLNGDDN